MAEKLPDISDHYFVYSTFVPLNQRLSDSQERSGRRRRSSNAVDPFVFDQSGVQSEKISVRDFGLEKIGHHMKMLNSINWLAK